MHWPSYRLLRRADSAIRLRLTCRMPGCMGIKCRNISTCPSALTRMLKAVSVNRVIHRSVGCVTAFTANRLKGARLLCRLLRPQVGNPVGELLRPDCPHA